MRWREVVRILHSRLHQNILEVLKYLARWPGKRQNDSACEFFVRKQRVIEELDLDESKWVWSAGTM